MNRKRLIALVLTAALLVSGMQMGFAADPGGDQQDEDYTFIENLTVNYQTNPLGVDENGIRFGWQMHSHLIGQQQAGYRIVVTANDPEGEVIWDSGVVESDLATGISYDYAEGGQLELETRYYWTVTVEDTWGNTYVSEPAYFETGAVWDGIVWIMPTKSDINAGNTYDATTEQQAGEPASGGNYNRRGGNPLLRTEAALEGDAVASATLYMTGLGNYDAYINGEKVFARDTRGEEMDPMFAPGWTDFRYYTNYQTYDVTAYIDGDTVALGAEMHKGPYAGRVGNAPNYQNILGAEYGSTASQRTLALLAKLVITYEDGTRQVIQTEPDSWKSIAGPVTFNDYFNGELYDANRAKELEGWSEVGFDDGDWFQTEAIADDVYPHADRLRPNNAALARIAEEYTLDPVSGYKFRPEENISQQEAGIANTRGAVVPYDEDMDVTQPITLEYGEVLALDLAQNMVGVLELVLSGDRDTVVKVRHAEMVNDDSRTSDAARGTLYYGAMRGADGQVSYYTMSDDPIQTWRPHTTYNGFQHVEISVETPGREVTIHSAKGKVISSVHYETGVIETSDADVNRLIRNSFWGQMGNWTTVPTDCPQRSERCGWTGDIQIFSNTAMYNYDAIPFLDNYIMIADENAKNNSNNYGVVMPVSFQGGYGTQLASGWSDVGVVLPWNVYMQTGDTYVIERSFDQMDRYMDRVYTNGYGTSQFGDWLAFNGASLPFVNAAYEIYTTQLMEKMAVIIGREDKVEKYRQKSEELKEAFLAPPVLNASGARTGGGFVFDTDGVHAQTGYEYRAGDLMSYGNGQNNSATKINAQTALLWAIKCEMYSDDAHRQYLMDELDREITNENGLVRPGRSENTLAVGFLGVNLILPVLNDAGAPETAYNLLLQDEVPSWLGTVKNGATTNWERWDSYTIEDGFGSAGMNSFNHFSYGCVNEWMYEYMIGIKKVEEAPGFKEIVLQPVIDTEDRITYAGGSFESQYGKIESGWTTDDGALSTYSMVVPGNTTATLYLPVAESAVENFADIPGLTYVGMEDHNGVYCAKFTVASGGYDLAVENGTLVAELQDGYRAYADEVEVESVKINSTSLTSLKRGKTLELDVTITPESASGQDITWTSSIPSIATVDENGVVTAVKAGSTQITARASNGVSHVITLRVTN